MRASITAVLAAMCTCSVHGSAHHRPVVILCMVGCFVLHARDLACPDMFIVLTGQYLCAVKTGGAANVCIVLCIT